MFTLDGVLNNPSRVSPRDKNKDNLINTLEEFIVDVIRVLDTLFTL
jgi:hypothetical protein